MIFENCKFLHKNLYSKSLLIKYQPSNISCFLKFLCLFFVVKKIFDFLKFRINYSECEN